MKLLIIKDKNRMVRYRNRKLRTPVEIEISEGELVQMRTALKMAEIENYEIVDPEEKKQETVEDKELFQEYSEPIEIEQKLHEEPKSLLDKLARGE